MTIAGRMKGKDSLAVEEIIERLNHIQRDIEALRAERRSEGCRGDTIGLLVNQLMDDNAIGLEKGMVKKCEMRDTCKALFSEFLQKSAKMVGSEEVSEAVVSQYRSEMERMRSGAPHPQCSRCFGEVGELFDRHIRMARSMRVYRTEEEVSKGITDLSEEKVVRDLLEPLSNPQRLQILKVLSAQASSFTLLSQRTKLRGGNLLFHLQKLQDSGMIIQGQERGDYMITEEGYRVLRGISELYQKVKTG